MLQHLIEKTAITQDEFESLTCGDSLVGNDGIEWLFVGYARGFADWEPIKVARCIHRGHTHHLTWENGCIVNNGSRGYGKDTSIVEPRLTREAARVQKHARV